MKPIDIIKMEKEITRKKLSEYFESIQTILDSYEEITGDSIKEVIFSRIDVAEIDAECQKFKIGHVDLIFY